MKKYWKDIDARHEQEQEKEARLPDRVSDSALDILEGMKIEGNANRRDFLKFFGYSFALAGLASCHTKVRKAVPYAIAPHEITPGEANYYASSYIDGSDYCSIIVKTREGRPIKIEGNPDSKISQGGTTARVQASVLSLYDTNRYREPLKDGQPAGWESVDTEIIAELRKISDEGGKIIILTPTIYSPSSEAVIREFTERFPGTEWVQYDAVSSSAILEANLHSYGRPVIPDYRFDKADVVVSMAADFLGTWLSPIEYTRQFSTRRDPDKDMCYLMQFESNLSLTGSNADKRIQIKPSQEAAILLNIYKNILKEVDNRDIDVPVSPVDVKDVSDRLLAAKGKSLIVSATNNRDIQILINQINKALGNIGSTILLDSYLRTHSGIDNEMEQLVSRMNAGEIDALVMCDVNPAYTWHDRDGFINGLKKVSLSVSMNHEPDESSQHARYVCPDNHYLESWNDAEAKKGSYSLMQPVMNSIYNTRQYQDTLLKWSGSDSPFYEFLMNFWTENLMPLQTEHIMGEVFFNHTLQKGIFEAGTALPSDETELPISQEIVFDPASLNLPEPVNEGAAEIILYESVSIGNGRQANNPWLQELPDPVTRICWDNYACLSPGQAKDLGLETGDVVTLEGIDVPVVVQPGQAYGTIGLALGYGRTNCGSVGNGTGVDAWPFTSYINGTIRYSNTISDIVKTGNEYLLARTQTHHSMEGRALVREAEHKEYKENQSAGNEQHSYNEEHLKSLYKGHEYPHHHWGLAIDLSTCTGCANCVIACQAENNIPVVGKEEVQRVHEMHWLRIDRYFSGDAEDPEVVFQPVMCQHCDNAPCENVCPVAATNHSSEGLNQMIYNRCIGTRYCNNNCPYKVRRFNWFNYTEAGTISGNLRDSAEMTSDLRRMVLNPDVTVRSQGVIEKCSFCVQRIQASKLKAKAENRGVEDSELQTACSQSCPAGSIVFGDMNDPASEISKLMVSGRKYNLLEEIYTKPSVHYLTKIRNKLS